jgi:hypothetical protein
MNRTELTVNADQLISILSAKIKAARKAGPENLSPALLREVRNSLQTATDLIAKVDAIDGIETDPEPTKPEPVKIRKVKDDPTPRKPRKKKKTADDPLAGIPKLGDMDLDLKVKV